MKSAIKSYLHDAVIALSMQGIDISSRLTPEARKAISDLSDAASEYSSALIDALHNYSEGDMGMVEARNDFKQAMVNAFASAFDAGYADGGGDANDESDAAARWLADREAAELDNINELFRTLKQIKKDDPNVDVGAWVSDRSGGYLGTLNDVYNMGKLFGAENLMLTFDGDDGAESCATCQRLKGERHPAKWWIANNLIPTQGNENFDCKGWNCKHGFRDDEGDWVTLNPENYKSIKGGPGSGNFGHAGRPGEVGGSGAGGEGYESVQKRPGSINPVNDITSMDKMYAIAGDMKDNGFTGLPILAYDEGDHYQAVTGSHRIYAAREAGIENIPVHEMNTSSWSEEEVNDFSDLNEDEDRANFLQSMADQGKVDQASADIMKAEVQKNYDNASLSYTEQAHQYINEKYNLPVDNHIVQQTETINTDGARQEYHAFMQQLQERYTNIYLDSSDAEMEKLENLEREAYRKSISSLSPQLSEDPKDANAAWLDDHNPCLSIYATGDGMTAWIVDGPALRSNVWQDFVDGGNHSRYPWTPAGEYWLDSCNVAEAAYNLIHETVEDRAMQSGLDYAEAHSKFANPAEYEARQHPDKVPDILRKLGWSV